MGNCDNKRPCPCTYDCPRHGKCCECVAHHRDHNEGVPGCFFSPETEATYDRSIEALCRDRGLCPLIEKFIFYMPAWRNWQTRRT